MKSSADVETAVTEAWTKLLVAGTAMSTTLDDLPLREGEGESEVGTLTGVLHIIYEVADTLGGLYER